MSTNIRSEHISAFEALTSGEHDNFALFSCFLDKEPVVAIVVVTGAPDDRCDYQITPLFVSVTASMTLIDHEVTPA